MLVYDRFNLVIAWRWLSDSTVCFNIVSTLVDGGLNGKNKGKLLIWLKECQFMGAKDSLH